MIIAVYSVASTLSVSIHRHNRFSPKFLSNLLNNKDNAYKLVEFLNSLCNTFVKSAESKLKSALLPHLKSTVVSSDQTVFTVFHRLI